MKQKFTVDERIRIKKWLNGDPHVEFEYDHHTNRLVLEHDNGDVTVLRRVTQYFPNGNWKRRFGYVEDTGYPVGESAPIPAQKTGQKTNKTPQPGAPAQYGDPSKFTYTDKFQDKQLHDLLEEEEAIEKAKAKSSFQKVLDQETAYIKKSIIAELSTPWTWPTGIPSEDGKVTFKIQPPNMKGKKAELIIVDDPLPNYWFHDQTGGLIYVTAGQKITPKEFHMWGITSKEMEVSGFTLVPEPNESVYIVKGLT